MCALKLECEAGARKFACVNDDGALDCCVQLVEGAGFLSPKNAAINPIGASKMAHDFSVTTGDICEDPIGLRVRVDDVDMYDYVHFSVLENRERDDKDIGSGEMSHIAFVHRFTKLGNLSEHRPAA